MSIDISVILPIGPYKNDTKWLEQCVDSLIGQTLTPAGVVFVNDMANLPENEPFQRSFNKLRAAGIRTFTITNMWRLGCAASWNIGLMSALTPFAFLMGADDWLDSMCLAACADAYKRSGEDVMGYYFVGVRYVDENGTPTGEEQTAPCNAAMVTKALWRHTGGFSPEMGLGAPDAAFISILLAHPGSAGNLRAVSHGAPLYNARRHSGQDTGRQGRFYNAIINVRDVLTRDWQPAEWAR